MARPKQDCAALEPSGADRVVKTRVGRMWLGADGIMRGLSDPGAELTIEDVHEIQQRSRELVGEGQVPSLVDITNVRSITADARRAWGDPHTMTRTVALAMVVSSPVSRVLGNIFLGLNRPSYPVKLFTSAAAAVEWLRRFNESTES